MTITLDTPIMGYRETEPGLILSRMDRPDEKDGDFLDALIRWCRVALIDEAIPESQFLLETDNGRSVRWNRDLNASGMGIVSDGTPQPFYIPDVTASAKLFVQCLYSLVNRERHPDVPLTDEYGHPWAEGEDWFSGVWLPKVRSPAMPQVRTVADLGLRYKEGNDSRATWSWEKGTGSMDAYGLKLIDRLNDFYPNLPERSEGPAPPPPKKPEEENPMALEIVNRVIGVQGNAPDTPLNSGPGRLRPIIHNTDNPSRGADALMHAQFVANGGGSSNVSFHFAVDSMRAAQILPLNRIGYHASDGCNNRDTDTGCFDGIAIENCDNVDGDIDQTFDNLAELLACIEFGDPRIDYGGRPITEFTGFIDRTLGHHDVAFDAKWCPSDFMNRYGEEGYKTKLKAMAHAKLAAKRGTTPAPTYADAHPVAKGSQIINGHQFLAPGGKTFQRDTIPAEWGDGLDNPTGPTIKKGTKITADQISHYVVGTDEGLATGNLWVVLTGVDGVADGSRVPASALIAEEV